MRQLNGAHKEPQTVYPLIDFCTDLHMAAHHEFLEVLGDTLAWLGNYTSVEHPLSYSQSIGHHPNPSVKDSSSMVNFLYSLDTFHTVPETKISPENSVVGSWKMKFPLEMVPFQRCFMLIFGLLQTFSQLRP